MAHPFETFADRYPAATDRILNTAHLTVLTVPAATVLAAITGHTVLTVIGVFASIAFYATGYGAAARRYIQRGREQLAQARRDPLTGLPNRAIADQVLADTTGGPMAVALIDVHGLHMINLNLGHAAGDQYLVAIARRLERAIPAGGVLVRQGGDEFTLLAPGTDPQQLTVDIGAALAGPTLVAGYRIQARASVGIAATNGGGDGNHARARADSAMSTAKRAGGNQILVFDPARDPEPKLDGTRPLVRRRDIDPLAGSGVAWQPTTGDDLVPLLLAHGDVRTVHDALNAARDRWTEAVAQARAGAARPESPASDDPGRLNIEPTPTGYAGIARLAQQQQARYTRLIDRLAPLLETAESSQDAARTSAAARRTASTRQAGISAAFTPAEIEALVITAAEAVNGQPDDLSRRQRELAARAYALLQAANDD